MKIYLVGGAVRDYYLKSTSADYDYVVVGSSPEEMLAMGFKQVGAAFPVFLHPITQEEYALARIERKTGDGYHGFKAYFGPEVTLEEDLARRDLTMNAMALPLETGSGVILFDNKYIIDPFNGRRDLDRKVLCHVSEAFAEDPLRVLRVARFAAKFNFSVHQDTLDLMMKLVRAGEIEHLTKERVWKEISRGLLERYPHCMFLTLHEVGALAKLGPWATAWLDDNLQRLTIFSKAELPLEQLNCAVMEDCEEEWKLPSSIRETFKAYSITRRAFLAYKDLVPEQRFRAITLARLGWSNMPGKIGLIDTYRIIEMVRLECKNLRPLNLFDSNQVINDLRALASLNLQQVVDEAKAAGKDIKSTVEAAKIAAIAAAPQS